MRLVNDDNTSQMVEVETHNGDIVYIFESVHTLAELVKPEILFNPEGIVITGYVKRTDGLYKMQSFHLSK
jgi:hypothetical protein